MYFVKMRKVWLIGVFSAFLIGCGGGGSSDSDAGNVANETDLIANFLYVDGQDLVNMGKDVVEGTTLTRDFKGRENMAYAFDGISSAIEIPHNTVFNIQKQITLSAWVYASEQKSAVIIRKGAAINGDERAPYELSIAATGKALFTLNLPDANGNMQWIQLDSSYPTGVWFHMTGTYDGSTMKLYINGTLENTQDVTGEMNTNQLPLLIGTRLKLQSSTLNGKLANVRIYSRALGEDEVTNLATE